MGWLWAIIVGFVLGLLAKAILPGKQHSPLWLITIFGIIGGVVGNAIAGAFGVQETAGIDWWRHLFQIVAAVVIVGVGDALYMNVRGRKQAA